MVKLTRATNIEEINNGIKANIYYELICKKR